MSFTVPADAQKVLTQQEIEQKINRMAFEILELYFHEKEVVIIGIEDGGFHLAGQLAVKMQTIHNIKVELLSLFIEKQQPYTREPFIRQSTKGLKNKAILLVDDVGNSGATLFNALTCLYPLAPKSLHVALLIDRMHKRYPIKADVVGLDLATTLTEHIHVVFNAGGQAEGVYLF